MERGSEKEEGGDNGVKEMGRLKRRRRKVERSLCVGLEKGGEEWM